MCNSNPSIRCFQQHHVPVVLEVWASHGTPGTWGSDLLVATRTDLDNAKAIVSKMYLEGGITALVRDWFTGEITYLTAPKRHAAATVSDDSTDDIVVTPRRLNGPGAGETTVFSADEGRDKFSDYWNLSSDDDDEADDFDDFDDRDDHEIPRCEADHKTRGVCLTKLSSWESNCPNRADHI